MTSLIALCVSIGVLGGVATYLALGPLAGIILIWGIFIGWATFFAIGGDTAALKKTITCNVFGVICGWIMAKDSTNDQRDCNDNKGITKIRPCQSTDIQRTVGLE